MIRYELKVWGKWILLGNLDEDCARWERKVISWKGVKNVLETAYKLGKWTIRQYGYRIKEEIKNAR